MVHRQSPIFINIYLVELVDNDKKHTNEIMHQVKDLDFDDRCIFLKLHILLDKPPLTTKKMITKVQLLKELMFLKFKIRNMPEKLAKDAIVFNV